MPGNKGGGPGGTGTAAAEHVTAAEQDERHRNPVTRLDPELYVPAIYRAIAPVVTSAQKLGPLPSVTTAAFLTADPVQQLAAVLVLGLAYVVHGDPGKAALRQAGHDVREAADWPALIANHVTHEELRRRRAEPGPMATGGAA